MGCKHYWKSKSLFGVTFGGRWMVMLDRRVIFCLCLGGLGGCNGSGALVGGYA